MWPAVAAATAAGRWGGAARQQRSLSCTLPRGRDTRRDVLKAAVDVPGQLPPDLVELYPVGMSLKKRNAEPVFELFDLTADRTGRHPPAYWQRA